MLYCRFAPRHPSLLTHLLQKTQLKDCPLHNVLLEDMVQLTASIIKRRDTSILLDVNPREETLLTQDFLPGGNGGGNGVGILGKRQGSVTF